jgi:hypothetical protein
VKAGQLAGQQRFLFSWLGISIPVGLKHNASLDLVFPLPGFIELMNVVKPTLFRQAFIDIDPGTGDIFTHFTVAILGTPAGSIKKPFGTHGYGTYASGNAQHTVTATLTAFFIPAYILVYSDKG